jgi:hypothetical protein
VIKNNRPLEPTEIEDWARTYYHEPLEDIRWAKERASSVTYWSALLSGAVLIVNEQIPIARVGLIFFTLLQVGCSFLWLKDLHDFASQRRTRGRDMLPKLLHGSPGQGHEVTATVPPPAQPQSSEAPKPDDHIRYLIVQTAVIVAGGAVTLLVLA